jgi:hypothetical protein
MGHEVVQETLALCPRCSWVIVTGQGPRDFPRRTGPPEGRRGRLTSTPERVVATLKRVQAACWLPTSAKVISAQSWRGSPPMPPSQHLQQHRAKQRGMGQYQFREVPTGFQIVRAKR